MNRTDDVSSTRGQTIALVVALTVLAACNSPLPVVRSPEEIRREEADRRLVQNVVVKVAPSCPPREAPDHFFPKGMFFEDFPDDDEIIARFASDSFRLTREPSLSCGESPDEAYRLVVGHSFIPDSWSVRAFRHGSQRQLIAVKTRVDDVYRAAEIARVERTLSRSEWARFRSAINRYSYWSKPSHDRSPMGTDGGGWRFEGRKNKVFHPVFRSSGDRELSEIVSILQQISGGDVDLWKLSMGER